MSRKIIVHIATSADGYIARADGDLSWLTSQAPLKGFYGLEAFRATIDTKLLGRQTYEASRRLGAKFDSGERFIVFSRNPRPTDAPASVEFTREDAGAFARRLKEAPGKDIWLMGGGGLIASFLDAGAIDEVVLTVKPVFIGDGIPLIERKPRLSALELISSQAFEDGAVQQRYRVRADP